MSLRLERVAFIVILGALLLVLPIFLPSYILHMLILVGMYAYLATAWNILGGYAGQLSLGHALFIGSGAYTSTLLLRAFKLSPWLGMLGGAIIATSLGLFIGYLSFRYRIRGPFFALVTLAFAQIFVYVASNTREVGGASGLMVPLERSSLLAYQFTEKLPYYYIVLALVAVGLGLTWWLRRSKTGFYFLSIRENEDAAQALGINLMKYKLLATAISTSLSALGGTFYAQYVLFVDPPSVLSPELSLEVIIYSVVGGMGTTFGPLLGAAVLVPVAEVMRATVGKSGVSGAHLIVYGAFLVTMMLFFPDGIMGLVRKMSGPRRRAASALSRPVPGKKETTL